MVQSLEEYVAQSSKAYQPAYNAIQSQLDALAGKLETTNQQINKNYAQQQSTLNRNRNAAAETASMQAAGSGGSFGGAANLANRKYYEQSFVPAITQMQTNQANDLSQAKQNNENERISLNTQLANLKAQAEQEALRQYWAEVQAEKERENQRRIAAQQVAAANSANQRIMDALKNASQEVYKNWNFGNGYTLQALPNGEAAYYRNGNLISAGNFLAGTGANGAKWDLWKDVWNNGVSTKGVGSDTVAAFNRVSPTSSRYNYLF